MTIYERIIPLLCFPVAAAPEVNQSALEAAKRIPVGYRLTSTAKNGLYSYATQQGIPAVLLEIGQQGLWSQQEVELGLSCIKGLLGYLGLVGEDTIFAEQQQGVDSVYEEASKSGFWYPVIDAGEAVKQGQILGVLRDFDDQVLQVVEAKYDGIVWYYTTSLGVQKNDPLVAYGRCG